ncbi:NfeD family protein [Arhodomonas sp. SL1]|uniref:NfeD family protein n=1 Tax=Arhodomonas sp. SL1 TaxID=3425691 RepID=UPI003F882E28
MRLPLVARYALIQLPELGLVAIGLLVAVRAGWLAPPTAGLIAAGWLVKDAVLYPLYRHALHDDVPTGAAALVGREGVAVGRLDPEGWVRIAGERWRARAEGDAAVEPGAAVVVIAAAGLRLTVRPKGSGE